MFNKFSEEAKQIINIAKKEMIKLNHPYLGSEHILLGILKSNNNVSQTLKKYNITYKNYRNKVVELVGVGDKKDEWVLYTPIVKEIFARSIDIASENNNVVSIENLFVALIEVGEGIAHRVLELLNVDIDKIYTDFIFQVPKKNKKKKSLLNDVGYEYTNPINCSKFDPVIGRDKEIKEIIEILVRKNKSNPLLIGDAGVGKTAIIEEISRMIVSNNVPNKLRHKRIINLDMASLVAGTKYRGEFEEKLNKIIKEAENDDDIILFIDEIHTIIGAGGAEGAIDASNIFKPSLARGNIKCIGATTLDEYKQYIEKDKALERRFKKVIIKEPTIDEVKEIIYKIKPIYENYHHVSFKKNILDLLINLTNKYIHGYKNPDKTIDILDEVCAHANLKENTKFQEYNHLSEELQKTIEEKKKRIMQNDFKNAYKYKYKENMLMTQMNELEIILTNKRNSVTKKDLFDVLSNKINNKVIPELNKNFNSKGIIKKLNKQVIAQEEAINKLVDAYMNNLNTNNVFSVLLNGPSGVGKTSLAMAFANTISSQVIRIDMSEYSEAHTISRLIGAPPGYVGYDSNEHILDKVREYPFSVIVLDEIEKCHEKVLNLFFQILDNSMLKDSKNNNISFNQAIIIMTTNVESNKKLGFDNSKVNSELNDYFTIPFINRIDEIITLNSLDQQAIMKIIKHNLETDISGKSLQNKALDEIVKESNYQEYGARKLSKLLANFKKIKKIGKNYSKN